jgi:hypothetical protein
MAKKPRARHPCRRRSRWRAPAAGLATTLSYVSFPQLSSRLLCLCCAFCRLVREAADEMKARGLWTGQDSCVSSSWSCTLRRHGMALYMQLANLVAMGCNAAQANQLGRSEGRVATEQGCSVKDDGSSQPHHRPGRSLPPPAARRTVVLRVMTPETKQDCDAACW